MIRHPSLQLLSADHHRGIALALQCRKHALGQVRPTGSEGLSTIARELREFFTRNLAGHFRAEEEVLFPLVVESHPEQSAFVQSLKMEHEKIRRGVEDLASGRNLAKLLFDVGDVLERHVRREERELFPLITVRLTTSEGERVKERIAQLAGPR